MRESDPSRRAAVGRLMALGAGLAAVPGCGWLGLDPQTEVAPLESVPAGSALRTTVRDHPVILIHVEGRIRAFSGICTHESCELGWNQRQQLIRCPCHGSAFDTEGQVKLGPAERALAEYPVSVRNGKVFLTL